MSVSGDQEDLNNNKRDPLMDDFMEAEDAQPTSREADDRREDGNDTGDKSETKEDQADDSKQGQNEDEIRGKRVFVGNLSFKTTSRQLKEYMSKVGDVVKVDIFEDKNGNSKGFGLVEFTSVDDTKKAIAEMNQTSLDGRQIFVREDNAKQSRSGPLLVRDRKRRNDSPRRSGSRRRRHSRSRSHSGGRRHGGRDRDRRRRSRSRSNSRSYSPKHRRSDRGDYEKRRDRSRSRDERRRSRSKDRNRRSRSRDDKKSGKGGHQVIVKNMPWSVTWQQLKDAFKEYGAVIRAEVPQDGSGRSKGYGYVKFEKESEAQKAIGGMDGASFNGRKIVVKLSTD